MSKTNEPDGIYTITERNYNILQTQIDEIQNMLIRRDHYILMETAMDELAMTLRNAITPKKTKIIPPIGGIFYTLRIFFGRQPLCGMRVVSVMDCTTRPAFANPRTADSRP